MTKRTSENPALAELNFESLAMRKVSLEARLAELTGEMDGLNDPAVAAKIQKFELDKEDLDKKKALLETTMDQIDCRIRQLGEDIRRLSKSAEGRIVSAITGQRIFFLKNKPYIMFDTHTGLVFPNFEYYNIQEFDANGNTDMAIKRLKVINAIKECPYKTWRLPGDSDVGTYFNAVADIIKISGKKYGNIIGDATTSTTNDYLRDLYTASGEKISMIDTGNAVAYPFNSDLFSNDLSPASKVYGPVERANKIIDIFLSEQWIPKFNDGKITELYERIYVDRPAVVKELAEVMEKLAEFPPSKRGFSDGLDFESMIGEYDLAAIEKSPIRYFDDAVRWYGALLADLDDFSRDHSNLLSEAMTLKVRIASNRDSKSVDVLERRTNYLANQLDFGLEALQANLIAFKEEAEQRREDLDRAKSLLELRAVEKVERPDFFLLAEQSARLVKIQLDRVEWFQENKEAVTKFVELHEEWVRRHHEFEHTTFEHFLEQCMKQAIEREVGEAWCSEWAQERRVAEERLLPLLKAALEGMIQTEVALDVVRKMDSRVQKQFGRLYIEQRIPIYQSYAGEPGGEFLERIKLETELAKIDSEFQKDLEDSIFSIPDTAGRLFLVRWAGGWFDSVIGRVIAFIEEGSIAEQVAKETLGEFRELKRRNLEAFLQDARLFAVAREKIATEYNSLVFRLKTGLVKKNKKALA